MGKKGGTVMPAEIPSEIIKRDYQPIEQPKEETAVAIASKTKKKKGPSTMDVAPSIPAIVKQSGLNI